MLPSCGAEGRRLSGLIPIQAGQFPLEISRAFARAFTLVEMLAAITVFLIMMAAIGGIMNQTRKTIHVASSSLDMFQSVRLGFDSLAQNLSHATLNTYWDYDSATAPTNYVRKSDLDFVINRQGDSFGIFFQAPRTYSTNASYNQTSGLLNAIGYYVEYGSDDAFRPNPPVQAARYRYRLMQALQPTESLSLFSTTDSSWITGVKGQEWPVADNVIALIAWPRLSTRDDAAGTKVSADYAYDSRGAVVIQQAQLPPLVQVMLLAISESSAARLNMGSQEPAAIQGALQGKFQDVANYAGDLKQVESQLTASHIEYKEFTTSVPIRESKWSGQP